MKKTYCDKCGKEFEPYAGPVKNYAVSLSVGEFETKHPSEEYTAIHTTHIFVELSSRCCGAEPHELCKTCLLAIITNGLAPELNRTTSPALPPVRYRFIAVHCSEGNHHLCRGIHNFSGACECDCHLSAPKPMNEIPNTLSSTPLRCPDQGRSVPS